MEIEELNEKLSYKELKVQKSDILVKFRLNEATV